MPSFKAPLSGDVAQWINPMTWFFSGNTVNVTLGESSAPEVEAAVLEQVGSYGRQLGRLSDALLVLLKHLPDREHLTHDERRAIEKFEAMAAHIADIKRAHGRHALFP